MPSRLVFRPRARRDLDNIHDFIAADSPANALDLIDDVQRRCELLVEFPEQGRARDDLAPGLRILPFDRRVVVAYVLKPDVVEIVRVLYGGQDYEDILGR